MKKFKLKLTKDFWESNFVSQRKHSNVEIAFAVNPNGALRELFKTIGPHLRTLIITNSQFDDFTFTTMLKCSSWLEELYLSEVVIEQKLPAINPISIVHLQSVTIHYTNWIVFQFLIRSQINKLDINSYLDEGEGTRVHLVRMLSNQYRLRELMLYGTSPKTLFKDGDVNDIWKFRLRTFHIGCGFGKNSEAVDNNIVQFLTLNIETLRNVEIEIPDCELITAFTLLHLGNVTSLTLDIAGFPKYQTFYELLTSTEPNLQLKHLKLSGFFCKFEFVRAILQKYPAISNLELDDWSGRTSKSDTLKFVSETFPELEQLFVPEISDIANTVRFNALKQLHVCYIRNTRNLINVVRRNSSIEVLKIGFVHTEQIASVRELVHQTNVQHLSFAGSTEILRLIVDLIQTNTPETLKTLELCSLSSGRSFTDPIAKFKIHFPFDRNLTTKLDVLLQ